MSLLNTVRNAVKIADKITKPLQATVTLEVMSGQDVYGNKTFGGAVPLAAIVDWKQRQVRTIAGLLTVSRASVTFLDAAAVAAATNGNGIGDDDRITLPDGTQGAILDMAGFIDAGTGHPIATEVYLG